jgi:DNA gyrase subunit B
MLFELASEEVSLRIKGILTKGKTLIPYLRRLSEYVNLLEWFGLRRKDTEILEYLLDEGVDAEILKDQQTLESLCRRLSERFPNLKITEITFDEEHNCYSTELRRLGKRVKLNAEFFSSPDFKEIVNLHRTVDELGPKPFLIRLKEEEKTFTGPKELLNFIMDVARKGLTIQRYKGLGEMNPQQLWETTMDPEKRTLLQVTIEDSVQADQIFTVLMGEQVEPRKEFIIKHALEARNIDI